MRLTCLLASLLLLASAGFVWADAETSDAPALKDSAHFFSEEAVKKAIAEIDEIRKDYNKDLRIETFDDIPESLQSLAGKLTKDQFYDRWLTQEARRTHTNGVFILVVKKTAHLQVGAGKRTREKAFTVHNCDQVRDTLVKAFKQKQYDDGLAAAVFQVRTILGQNLAGQPPEAPAQVAASNPATTSPAGPATRPGATTRPASDFEQPDPIAPAARPPADRPAKPPATPD